jgi:hypothetical protein
MAEMVPVYVLTTPEVRAFLADNETSLAELLRREGVEVEEEAGANPVRREEGSTKEPVTILLASAAVIATLTPVVTRVLQRFSRKPVVAEEQVLLPVLDGSGAPVKDKDGEPLTYWATRARVLTDAQPKLANSKIEVQGPSGIKVSYEDK